MRTRFAPSPTGPLHLGHAYAAIMAHDLAMQEGGKFLLRIEDIDQSRASADWEQAIYNDLEWLGLCWEEPVMRQSDRLPAYRAALDGLWARQLLFRCDCSRRDIEAALSAPQEGAPLAVGPDGRRARRHTSGAGHQGDPGRRPRGPWPAPIRPRSTSGRERPR